MQQLSGRFIVNFSILSLLLLLLLISSTAHAAIITTSVSGGTSYGATGYCCVNNGAPTYIANNVTGNNDILTSPGGGFQTANPVIGNNVAQSGIVNAPYFFNWAGGTGGLSGAPFGIGLTTVTGSGVGFALSDATAGCCSASYSITSINDTYTVGAGGYNGTFGAYLSISGTNSTINDSAVASAIVEYSINGGAFIFMPQMVLAANGNCNNVTLGGSGAAIVQNGCAGNKFTGLSIDNLGAVNWAQGTTIQIIAAITAYADPANFDILDSYIPDANLISLTGATLPGFTGAVETGVAAPTPEPATLALTGLALLTLNLLRRRKPSADS
jgi:hypothetical protein